MDPIAHVGHPPREEFLARAAHHRLARSCRPDRPRISLLLRLYARLWWASRPRVDAWPRAVLTP